MMNKENESSGTANQERAAGIVIDDIWSTFPNVHLRVLTAENESVEIQICDCGMSGHCRPQGWARIERHNRQRLADAITAAPVTGTGDDDVKACDGSMSKEQLRRAALVAESRGIDPETAQEIVYLRDRVVMTYYDGHLDGLREAERLSCLTGAIRERITLAETERVK